MLFQVVLGILALALLVEITRSMGNSSEKNWGAKFAAVLLASSTIAVAWARSPYASEAALIPTANQETVRCAINLTPLSFLAAVDVPGTRCAKLSLPKGSDARACKRAVAVERAKPAPSEIELFYSSSLVLEKETIAARLASDPSATPAARDVAQTAALEQRARDDALSRQSEASIWRAGLSWENDGSIMHCEAG